MQITPRQVGCMSLAHTTIATWHRRRRERLGGRIGRRPRLRGRVGHGARAVSVAVPLGEGYW
jgi:hypothetical protein